MSSDVENTVLAPQAKRWWDAAPRQHFGLDEHASPPQRTTHSGLLLQFDGGTPKPLPIPTRRHRFRLMAKRAFDIAAAGFALLCLAPLLLFIAMAIGLTSPGPIFFRQERVGLNGRTFRIFKFRTMRMEDTDDSGVRQTVEDDPRVTPFGRFLRRKSLDELPQLFNVLRGEMSLVGPRPHVAGQLAADRPFAAAVPYYDHRHVMLPGLTGWAQVNGYRGPTDTIERAKGRVDHDLAYIQNFTLLLDVHIIVRTVHRELTRGSGF